jgi:L-ascorbate metabolism protein UlaG (beta-lactamase superfamily)
VRITYVGHATVHFEAGATRLLTDPVLRTRIAHLRRIVPLPPLEQLVRPDAVLISHAHLDHLDVPSLRMLDAPLVIAPRGCGRVIRRAGAHTVIEVQPGQELTVGSTSIRVLRLAHDGRRHPLSSARETLGYTIAGDERALVAGDTAVFDGMSTLAGSVDVALLPVWGWGRRLGPGHMGPAEAARAAATIRPRLAIPIHWGTLASPRVPWLGDPARPAREFARHVAATGIEARIVPPGGCLDTGDRRRANDRKRRAESR